MDEHTKLQEMAEHAAFVADLTRLLNSDGWSGVIGTLAEVAAKDAQQAEKDGDGKRYHWRRLAQWLRSATQVAEAIEG